MADSNNDTRSIEISQEIKNIIFSLNETDLYEDEIIPVQNYKTHVSFREKSLDKLEKLKLENAEYSEIKTRYNITCTYSSSVRYWEQNDKIKNIIARIKQDPNYLYDAIFSTNFSSPLQTSEETTSCELKETCSPIKSIFLAILLLIIFGIVSFVSILIIAFVLGFLADQPVIGNILSWLFSIVDGSPTELVNVFSILISYFVVAWCANKISKNKATAKLSIKISCFSIIVLHILFLILNVIYKENVFANIITILYSFAFLHTLDD